jgi:hypothetical protein
MVADGNGELSPLLLAQRLDGISGGGLGLEFDTARYKELQ